MKTYMTYLAAIGLLMFVSLGCEPRPIDNDPNVPDDIETDVDMDDDAEDATAPSVTPPTTETVPPANSNPADNTGVDVEVGGEQGVDVNVDPDGTGADVNVGGAPNTNPQQ